MAGLQSKNSMKIFLKILFLLLLWVSSCSVKAQCLTLDLVLLVDGSGSVSDHVLTTGEAISRFADRFDYSYGGLQMGVVTFASGVSILSDLTYDKEKLIGTGIQYIENYGEDGLSTNLSSGFQVATKMLLESERDVNKMIIVVTDGVPDSETLTSNKANIAKDLGFKVCGVFIDAENGQESYLITLTSDCYVSTVWELLVNALEELDICG